MGNYVSGSSPPSPSTLIGKLSGVSLFAMVLLISFVNLV